MTLGDVFMEAVNRDMAGKEGNSNQIFYTEFVKDNEFEITFGSKKYPTATINVSLPYSGKPEEENYARLYFLSMVFNAAIYGQLRLRTRKNKKR